MFEQFKQSCSDDWRAYTEHRFVVGIATGTLPEACFRHYLKQDYLFLVHFARAYALAAYKSRTLADIRHAKAVLSALVLATSSMGRMDAWLDAGVAVFAVAAGLACVGVLVADRLRNRGNPSHPRANVMLVGAMASFFPRSRRAAWR